MDEQQRIEEAKTRARARARAAARKSAATPPPKFRPPDPEPAGPDPGPARYRWVFHAPQGTPPGAGEEMGFQMPVELADLYARHAERAGLIHVDDVAALADKDGTVAVAGLPRQVIRHDPPEAGPECWVNPGKWVPMNAPPPKRVEPEPVDVEALSDDQVKALKVEREAIDEALRRRSVWEQKMRVADDPAAHRGHGKEV
ncbi:phage gene 29 protein family protein [Tomitella gaofuii]|uniref:phage gene 29 protein family protein n=1 Tax=Tomitella gaofuii TaxID=2760083 RepID=UPI0015FCD8C3|nr:DUF2744 domain-containing protein [Tomitella gaofuii]